MPYVGQKPADIISTAVDTVTGTFSGEVDAASLDISGNIDVDGTTNLDVVDIDGVLTQDGGAVFNEASADVDFRVESNGNANMLFVDGGNDKIGVGTASPDEVLHIHSDSITRLKITGSSGQGEDNGIKIFQNGVNTSIANGDNGYMRFYTNNAEQVRIHSNGVLSASDGIALGVGTANTASNVISDYEEGEYVVTATPSAGGTITLHDGFNTASYTKIGRLVHVSGLLNVDSVSSPSGFVGLNLPFTPANLGERSADSAGSIYITGSASNFVRDYVATVNEGDARIFIQLGDGTSGVNDSAQQIQANANFVFSMSYHTA